MKVCATIPIKTRSTRVPYKNFKALDGRPLYQHIILNCLEAGCFDNIYIDTDSEEIKKFCVQNKVNFIDRLPELALDTANGNDVFHYDIDYLTNIHKEYDFYFQLYATAPFLTSDSIKACVSFLKYHPNYDSILTCKEEYGWFWWKNQPINYQPNILPRSQDVVPLIKETTALYGISQQAYKRYRCRIGAKPYFYILTDPKEYLDLDTNIDFDTAAIL